MENEDGAFYVRKIAEIDLEANFDPETDGKTIGFFILCEVVFFIFNLNSEIVLSFQQALTTKGVEVDGVDDKTKIRLVSPLHFYLSPK